MLQSISDNETPPSSLSSSGLDCEKSLLSPAVRLLSGDRSVLNDLGIVPDAYALASHWGCMYVREVD